ncbi:tRNA epoxyqueuosine(34) reductase QueG [Candidatus Peregrinibacteria bacterium]|nr:tRNA epoxyqueuosine(34) reductase QueG [Candidatus Peregrinibacteria bacterium]
MNLRSYAKSLGFDIVRILPAINLKRDGRHLQTWLKKGLSADLGYMKNQPEKRFTPAINLAGAKSIICLAMNYFQPMPLKKADDKNKNYGRVARYAWGRDYHKTIEKKLKKLRKFIIEKTNASLKDFKLYSDAGPFLDRAYAAKAGIGFIGKNTTLITKEYGSWVFLAEVITTLKLDYDKQNLRALSCGSCNKCIQACPTGALIAPYTLDTSKCIAYQTIENKKKIPAHIRSKMKNRIFGCDICQEVCPHNIRAKTTKVSDFLNHITGPHLDAAKVKKMTEAEFNKKFAGSPIKRAGYKGIIRNIKHML